MAREYKRRHLPIDVIVCDFFHWPRLGDYCFDPEFFPDPAAMVRELKEMSIELLVSVFCRCAVNDRLHIHNVISRLRYDQGIIFFLVSSSSLSTCASF